MANVLYKVPLSEWVLGTIQKMNELRSTDVRDWTKVWYEVYQELGGKTPKTRAIRVAQGWLRLVSGISAL